MNRGSVQSTLIRSLPGFLALMISLSAASAGSSTLKTLYGFKGNDGAYPVGRLLLDSSGNIIGTTPSGGPLADGVVFELTPSKDGGTWNRTLLRVRVGWGADGANGGVISDQAGNLYGTTLAGGPFRGGTVFELSPPKQQGGAWIFTVLHAFQWGKDGARPYGGVVIDQAGNLYGATSLGGGSKNCTKSGENGCGTVFQLTPPSQSGGYWTENVIYRFQGGTDGATPIAGLTIDNFGNLYGTTLDGGAYGSGTVFEVTPSASALTAHDAREPRTFLPIPTGVDGTVFQLSPPVAKGGAWTESILHSFNGSDGANPYGGLTLDAAGNLFGAATYGGNFGCAFGNSCGLVFQLQPPAQQGGAWTENILYEFPAGSLQGANPYAGVVLDAKGNLYGTTESGGFIQYPKCNYGCGLVFKLSPPQHGGPWTETILYEFQGGSDGANPGGDLIFDNKGVLYGTSQGGDPGGGTGTVFQIVP
jgi:uncharacterized repeat protein (TIGR03803 family)